MNVLKYSRNVRRDAKRVCEEMLNECSVNVAIRGMSIGEKRCLQKYIHTIIIVSFYEEAESYLVSICRTAKMQYRK